jgi:hypothetical protein
MSHINIIEIPAFIEFRSTPCTWEERADEHKMVRDKSGRYVHPSTLYERRGDILKRKHFDPWQVRSAFLNLKTDGEFLDFLNATGYFSLKLKNGAWSIPSLRKWQDVMRVLINKSPEHWPDWLKKNQSGIRTQIVALQNHDLPTVFRWDRKKRFLMFRINDCLSAILASIYLDHLRGVCIGFCSRQDCQKEFEIRGHKNKKYCSFNCAHMEVIRRGRARKREKRRNNTA